MRMITLYIPESYLESLDQLVASKIVPRRDYERFVDTLGDKLANVWVEVKEVGKK